MPVNSEVTTTPLMRQYLAIKHQYPHALVLFQVGDFYELFFDDAKRAASLLGIALTTRGKHMSEAVPLCGVPVHAVQHYLTKLIKAQCSVVLCDQLEPSVPGKVVKRGVTQVCTPGTLTDEQVLNPHAASYIAAVVQQEGVFGLVVAELLTGTVYGTSCGVDPTLLAAELARFVPDELIVADQAEDDMLAGRLGGWGYYVTRAPRDNQTAMERKAPVADETVSAAYNVLCDYLHKHQPHACEQLHVVTMYRADQYLQLDVSTQHNLELVANKQDGGRAHTLLDCLDGTVTAMGSRMIKKWLLRPSVVATTIEQRLDVVQVCTADLVLSRALQVCMRAVGDIERIVGRIALQRAPMHDYARLRSALAQLPQIRQLLAARKGITLFDRFHERLRTMDSLHDLLTAALTEQPVQDHCIRQGFNQELDKQRTLTTASKELLLQFERQEQETTGISSLKVVYHQQQGYCIEVTKTHIQRVPKQYQCVHTLSSKQRYTTSALQELERNLLQAQRLYERLQEELFEQIKLEVRGYVPTLRRAAQALAQLDALLGFSKIAHEQHYVRPILHDAHTVSIKQGRHPVVARRVGHEFIANDCFLNDQQSLLIITGPNMGGKSTYLRQVALMAIMAQCGSFVPAEQAELPLFDRIFTRIGAGDNVAEGKSTFLVEMEETAAICMQATKKSLVILDEVGRGTSTYDGLAIAQAVVEYLYTHVGARCLFATHYHELTALEQAHSGIVSFYAASTKSTDGIVLLHKIVRGIAHSSFGLDVAKLAGLPAAVIERARELEQQFDHRNKQVDLSVPSVVDPDHTDKPLMHAGSPYFAAAKRQSDDQFSCKKQQIDYRDNQLLDYLAGIDYDELSPRKAFDILWRIRQEML